MDDIDELIRRLYEQPPDGFVAGRAAAVAEAKQAGDKDLAKRLAALRKPTVAAWLVNLLALRRPELIADLVELAEELRQAQRGLQGEQLRELSTQRRQVVSALVAAAQKLAIADDPALRRVKLPMAEVESTLTAAMAEPDIAEQVRSGRLVKAATYAGFGEVPRPRLRLVTSPEPEGKPSENEPAERDRAAERERAAKRRELQRDLTIAQRAREKTQSVLEKAEAAESDAGHSIDELEEQIAELERRRGDAQAELSRRKLARRSAERDASAARRQVGDVEAAIEDLDAEEPG
ncbi:hypothetical protein GCM10010435_18310 [Winogradskya consettensis]|uniref:Uncharacterized protein n=1 Tax=Winogradskya consettensis TaxID=113560 RepID=A0A919SV12_9ACTN|nr:hypothetical protein [Actinoplanes consettensis]GIM78494.1 hypothetical protein Aco04nite_60740 [Actinoplanes consettensis]